MHFQAYVTCLCGGRGLVHLNLFLIISKFEEILQVLSLELIVSEMNFFKCIPTQIPSDVWKIIEWTELSTIKNSIKVWILGSAQLRTTV